MVSGLTFRAAARRVGCTHRAISEAIKHGRIKLQADGTVSPADVDAWHANRRARRGGARRNVSKRAATNVEKAPAVSATPDAKPQLEAAATPEPPLPDEALDASVAIDAGAFELARLVARYLPLDVVRELVAQWAAEMRRGWVGGPQAPLVPIAEIDAWPAPAGCQHWHDHQLFNGPPLHRADWLEVAADAAAWRAAHGTEAGK
jgi:hypothetical protein